MPLATRRAVLGALGVGALGLGWRALHRRGLLVEDDGTLDRGVTVQRLAMATVWKVLLPPGAPRRAVGAAERALDEVARLEDLLSEFRAHTELARVNATSGGRPQRVSPETLEVVSHALRYAALSQGAFDPTWAALRPLWSFREGARAPSPEAVRERLPLVDWRAVELDPGARTLRLPRAGMALGLGGIAKGYALDRMASLLNDAGARDYALYSGGQVLVRGTHLGRPWRVGVQHPRDPGALLGAVSLTRGTVSTGGDYEHYFEEGGRRYHHVLDPRTGWPVAHTAAVTVVAPTGLEGDALDTVLFALEPTESARLASRLGLAVLRTDAALRSEATAALRALFEGNVA
ncbi:MAG: FAD:protein FMN transferase [Deltaproteobacteria bacterium]|nr:FAD:protein FMN transferase [Deltaproteobacteria bacterium]